MFRGVFITGTDTDVGKTTVAAAMMHRYREFQTVRYWKPVQTGIEISDDTDTVRDLGQCTDRELHLSRVRLSKPFAPYLAAGLDGTRVTIESLLACANGEPDTVRWVAEGAGGVMVPINESEFMVDLMVALGMPVVIVARSSLGTINHTLLTIEALRRRKLKLAGVITVGDRNPDNCKAIEQFGAVPVVGQMPRFSELTPEVLNRWATSEFDEPGHLAQYFK